MIASTGGHRSRASFSKCIVGNQGISCSQKGRFDFGCHWLCQCDASEVFLWGATLPNLFHFGLVGGAAFQPVRLGEGAAERLRAGCDERR